VAPDKPWGNLMRRYFQNKLRSLVRAIFFAAALPAFGGAAAAQFAGTPVAWGDPSQGQCTIPANSSNIIGIAAGSYHNVALRVDGTVIAWGRNEEGQCNIPAGLSNVSAVAAGAYHSLALLTDGTVVAWGYNYCGQCNVPAGLSNVIAIAGGAYYSVALLSGGTLVAWGDNSYGQCDIPAGLNNVSAVAAGAYHTVALVNGGGVVAWGRDDEGQCDVQAGLGAVTAVAAGTYHTVALLNGGSVAAWGSNNAGQCSVPDGLSVVQKIAAGNSHTVALLSDMTVVAWGWNEYGQCNVPPGLIDVVALSAGTLHTLSISCELPTISVSASGTMQEQGQDISFCAQASDLAQDTFTYVWDFGDGSASNEQSPTHSYGYAGTYTVTVSASSGSLQNSASIVITIYATNNWPTPDFTADSVEIFATKPVIFDAGTSTDLANITSFSWDFGDDSSAASGQTCSYTYSSPGLFTVTLTVATNIGQVSSISRQIVVLPSSQIGAASNAGIKYKVKMTSKTLSTDTLSLSAVLNIGTVQLQNGQDASLTIAGETFSGKLGPTSNGANSAFTFKTGKTVGQVNISIQIKKSSLWAAFENAGVVPQTNASVPVQDSIGVQLVVDGISFSVLIPTTFKFGSSGTVANGSGTS
jgi:PKD repeat protein